MKNTHIFIITGPSGAGEDSIISELAKHFPIEKVVTTTTRHVRPGEINGVTYNFISKEEFTRKIEAEQFFEYAEEDDGNFYGGTKDAVQKAIDSGKVVIWKLDYKGAITIKKMIPSSISIFIDVPLEIIEQRIRRRHQVSEDFVQKRLAYAKGWYENKDKFDYTIKNEEDKLQEAVNSTIDIIRKYAKSD